MVSPKVVAAIGTPAMRWIARTNALAGFTFTDVSNIGSNHPGRPNTLMQQSGRASGKGSGAVSRSLTRSLAMVAGDRPVPTACRPSPSVSARRRLRHTMAHIANARRASLGIQARFLIRLAAISSSLNMV